MLRVIDAARFLGVTPQMIYTLIRKKRLEVSWECGRKVVSEKSLFRYRESLYSRAESRDPEGNLKFDSEAGYFSLPKFSDMIGVEYGRVYNAIKKGVIFADRKGSAYRIHKDEVLKAEAYFREMKNYKLNCNKIL